MPFEVEGETIRVLSEPYKSVIDSLVHIFRNAVDYGIEDADKRLASEKDMYGSIGIHVRQDGNLIELAISDNGAGIRVKALKEKTVNKGYYSHEAFDALDRTEQL